MAELDTNLQAGAFLVQAGEVNGAQKRKYACVFAPGLPVDANPNYVRPTLIVRAWIKKPSIVRTTVPAPDPELLEQLMLDLITTLQPKRVTLLDELYFDIAGSQIDYADWGVEVTLVGWAINPGAIPPV